MKKETNIKNKFGLVLFFCLISLESFAQVEIRSDNIKSLLEKQGPRIEIQKLELQAAENRSGSLARSFLPSLELQGASESFRVGEQARRSQPVYGAEVKMNLFNGFKDQREEQYRRLDIERRQHQGKRIISEDLDQARSTYWQIVFLREKQDLIKSSLLDNAQNLKSALRRLKSGVATDSDRVEFEMKDVELRREQAENQVELLRLSRSLALQLGVDAKEMVISEKLSHEHEFEGRLKHRSQDHDFLYKEYEVLAEQVQVRSRSHRDSWLPRVEAFASYQQYNEREKEFPDAQDRTESILGLRVKLNLETSFESQREARAQLKEAQAAELHARLKRQEVEDHLQGEMAELRLLHDQVHEAEQNIDRAQRYYKLTLSEYGRGVKNSPDVLGASNKVFEMRHKRLEIVRNFQLSKAHVLSKLGR